jgi:rhodanese-related sulfurtransferase
LRLLSKPTGQLVPRHNSKGMIVPTKPIVTVQRIIARRAYHRSILKMRNGRINYFAVPAGDRAIERQPTNLVRTNMNRHITTIGIAFVLLLTGASALRAADKPATQPSEPKKITLPEFETMRADKGAVVLDVRTAREFTAGHVPGAVNIDWHARDFADQVAKLDKSKSYLVHCQAGIRSAAAVKKMNTMDFLHLYDYAGGYAEYEKAGKPVEKPAAK